jgi:putative glutamine amidotransferase
MNHTKRPLIGITCLALRGKDWSELSLGIWKDCLYRDYTQSVVAAGGVPMGIPIVEDQRIMADMLTRVDGIILSGGSDVLPYLYNEDMRPGIGQVDYLSDQMEIEIARQTLKSEKPTLGICRGIQVMAVAAGGSLIQDITTQVPDPLMHWQKSSKDTFAHRVEILTESKLAHILGPRNIWVNSHHHQSVRDVPDGFLITARAGDGVIEAMEHPDHPFYVGVQWHPEGTAGTDTASLGLFEALVKASR